MPSVRWRSFARSVGVLAASALVLGVGFATSPPALGADEVAAQAASIHGTIVRPPNFTTSLSETIHVWREDGTRQSSVTSSSEGHFQVDVPAGTYRIQFSSHSGSILSMFWGDVSKAVDAPTLTVAPGQVVEGLEIRPVTPAWITGTVISTHMYPAGYYVELYSASGDKIESDALSPGTSRIGFAGLYPGRYKMAFRHYGLDGVEVLWHGGEDLESATDLVTLSTETLVLPRIELTAFADSIPHPAVAGTLAVGNPVSVTRANDWMYPYDAEFAYRWFADGVPVSGAADRQLWLESIHLGRRMQVEVVAAGTGFLPTTRRTPVTPRIPLIDKPTIAGHARTGDELTARPGVWTPSTTFTYQWFADGVAIVGANGPIFVPKISQDSKQLSVAVTGARPGFASATVTSSSTLRVTRWTSPTIVGELSVGSTVSANPNRWSTGTSFKYRWYADGKPVTPATTGSNLTLDAGLQGRRLTVTVYGQQNGSSYTVASSLPSDRVAIASAPGVTGTRAVGGTLAALPGAWTTGTTFAYQWYADGRAITGATRSTLVLKLAQRGKQISVTVEGRRLGYATVSRTSPRTKPIV